MSISFLLSQPKRMFSIFYENVAINKFTLYLLFVNLILGVSSCTSFKELDQEVLKGREPEYKAIVIKKNDEKITGDKLYTKENSYGETKYVIINGQKIDWKDVKGFQDDRNYRYYSDKFGYMSRLRGGKINLFYTMTNINGLADEHAIYKIWYVFEKEKGVFEYLNFDNFSNALSDNSQVLQKFKQLYPDNKFPNDNKINLKNITSVVDIYNK